MKTQEIIQVMIDVLKELTEKSGRPANHVNSRTRVATDIDGFDSMEGMLATVEIGAQLNCEIDDDNIFAFDGEKPPTIAEVASRLALQLGKK